MTAKQIGICLGYANPQKAMDNIYARYKDQIEENSVTLKLRATDGKSYKTRVYNEEGIYFIAFHAETERAFVFQKTVAKSLKQLRKGYQVWLLERERGKEVRRSLTDTIRDEYPDSPHKKFVYKNFTDLAYKAVTGKNAKQLKVEYGEPLRDNLPSDVLKRVKATEHVIEGLVELGYSYDKIKGLLNPQLEE